MPHLPDNTSGGIAMTTVSLTSAQNWYLIGLTLGSLAACLIFMMVRARRTFDDPAIKAQGIKLNSRMGQVGWDFSASFATNVAIIGSVFTIVLTSGAVPSTTTILPSTAYSGLAVFFGSVVVIAPLLYNGTAKRVPVASNEFDTAAEYHGTVWGFLLAALVTEWGLLGSIATVFVTLLELYNAGSLSAVPLTLLAITLFASVIFFARYSWVKVDGTIADQFDPAQVAARVRRSIDARQANNLAAPTAAQPPPSPRWTLL
jgi:hypothetical protein